jgi:O-antigen/teichoic acid export membrane protein
MLPAAGVMAVCGERLVFFLLGEGWEPASQLMATSAGLAISMTVALPARWILLADRNHQKLRIDSILQFSILLGVLAGSLLWGIQGSMSLNAIIVGPLAALASWMLLNSQFRRIFVTRVVPLALVLTAVPALLVYCVGLMTQSDFTFVASSAAIAAFTSIIALVLIRRRPRRSRLASGSTL